jgi:hypothetical protein
MTWLLRRQHSAGHSFRCVSAYTALALSKYKPPTERQTEIEFEVHKSAVCSVLGVVLHLGLAHPKTLARWIEVVAYAASDVAGASSISTVDDFCPATPAMGDDMVDRRLIERHHAIASGAIARDLALAIGSMV